MIILSFSAEDLSSFLHCLSPKEQHIIPPHRASAQLAVGATEARNGGPQWVGEGEMGARRWREMRARNGGVQWETALGIRYDRNTLATR